MNINLPDINSHKNIQNKFYKQYSKNNHPAWMFLGAYGNGKAYNAIKISKFLLGGSSELIPDEKFISNSPNIFHIKRLDETKK